jgi:hypothetical protein
MKRIYKVYYTVAGSLSIRNLDFLTEHAEFDQNLVVEDAKTALREQGNAIEILGLKFVFDMEGGV